MRAALMHRFEIALRCHAEYRGRLLPAACHLDKSLPLEASGTQRHYNLTFRREGPLFPRKRTCAVHLRVSAWIKGRLFAVHSACPLTPESGHMRRTRPCSAMVKKQT